MTEAQKEKLKRFINDTVMSGAVYEVLKTAFLSKKGQRDIQILAAERLAIDFLDEAFRELSKFQTINSDEPSQSGNIGL